MFKLPGDHDENSLWYHLLPYETRALDQAVKARRAAERAAVTATNAAAMQASSGDPRVAELEDKLFSLGLYTRTILQLLVDKGIVTTEEFAAQLEALDLLDGVRDGR